MAWEIVPKSQVSENIRIPVTSLQDIWYDAAIGLVERFSGIYIGEAANYTEEGDGTGSIFYRPKVIPVNSVSSLSILGQTIPSYRYSVRWDGIWFKDQRVLDTNPYSTGFVYYSSFPFGISNVDITYNAGGITNLPSEFKDALPMTLILVIKEMSVLFRTEGSDQVLEKYRPDRSKVKDEVLQNYGIHGKIRGIIKSWLPPKMRVG